MSLVELDRLRHAYVGVPGVSGLSVEQRKRLTLAVELVVSWRCRPGGRRGVLPPLLGRSKGACCMPGLHPLPASCALPTLLALSLPPAQANPAIVFMGEAADRVGRAAVG